MRPTSAPKAWLSERRHRLRRCAARLRLLCLQVTSNDFIRLLRGRRIIGCRKRGSTGCFSTIILSPRVASANASSRSAPKIHSAKIIEKPIVAPIAWLARAASESGRIFTRSVRSAIALPSPLGAAAGGDRAVGIALLRRLHRTLGDIDRVCVAASANLSAVSGPIEAVIFLNSAACSSTRLQPGAPFPSSALQSCHYRK